MSIQIGYSSAIYEIDPADLVLLPDCPEETGAQIHCSQETVVLIGNSKLGTRDTLVCGRAKVNQAVAENIAYIPVRFAFVSDIPVWNIFPLFIKHFRYKYKYFNSNIYHVSARRLRELGLERGRRNAENAYAITNKRWFIPEKERRRKYNELVQALKKGFSDEHPISIMLCRRCGLIDSIDNGHHRMGICIEHNIDRICTNFIAAGCAPYSIQRIFNFFKEIFK